MGWSAGGQAGAAAGAGHRESGAEHLAAAQAQLRRWGRGRDAVQRGAALAAARAPHPPGGLSARLAAVCAGSGAATSSRALPSGPCFAG